MRGVPRDGEARKGQGKKGDAGEVSDVRPARKLFGPIWNGPPREPAGEISVRIRGAKITSPNVKAWSRDAAVSAAAKRRRLRTAANLHALHAYLKAGLPSFHTVDVTLTRISPRQMDMDNCISGMKPVRDGVADAFDMRDDDPCIAFWYAQERGEYAIEITLAFYRESVG